ncbi:hypothetical protein DL98DRAFT_625341 [Cadophora sp. DSE1049]|nr:hypothetical protein DL98DRAFT_625341 [Cadophora sp. DSE1049]
MAAQTRCTSGKSIDPEEEFAVHFPHPCSTPTTPIFNPQNPDNSFRPFPRLPVELRLKIFLATMSARVVEVCLSDKTSSKAYDIVANVPPLLHVCQDSRMEGLRFYKILETKTKKAQYTHFHPLIDTLYLRTPMDTVRYHFIIGQAKVFIKDFAPKQTIHTLAVPFGCFSLPNFLGFVNLRKIIFTCGFSRERTQAQDFECPYCALVPTNQTLLLSIEDYYAHAHEFRSPNSISRISQEKAMLMIDIYGKEFATEFESLLAGEYKGNPWAAELSTFEYLAILDWNIREDKLYLNEDA